MKLYLIVTQAVYFLTLFPWFVIWGLSFMSFDAGFSTLAVTIVSIVSLYPVAVLVCSILGWVLHSKKKRAAIILNSIPLLWITAFIVLMVSV